MATERGVAEPVLTHVSRFTSRFVITAARATCPLWAELLAAEAAARLVSVLTAPGYTHNCDSPACQVQLKDTLARRCVSDPVVAGWATRCLQAAARRHRPRPRTAACGQLVRADCAANIQAYARVLHPGFATALMRHVAACGPSLPNALRAAARAGNVELVKLLLRPRVDIKRRRILIDAPELHATNILRALDGTTDLRIVGIIGFQLKGATYDDPDVLRDVTIDVLWGSAAADDAVRDALAEVVSFPDDVIGDAFHWAVIGGKTALARWLHARYPLVGGWALTFERMSELASNGHLDTLQWAVGALGLVDDIDGTMYNVLEAAVCADQLAVAQWLVESFSLSVHQDHCALLSEAICEESESVIEWMLREFPVSWRSLADTEYQAMRYVEDMLSDGDLSLRLKLILIQALGIRAIDVPPDYV